MFFWVALLTFVASILMFSFYPRNDGFELIDKREADGLVAPFVSQHLAALSAVKHKDGTQNPDYVSQMGVVTSGLLHKTGSIGVVNEAAMARYAPAGSFINASAIPGKGFSSIVLCIRNQDGALLTTCGQTDGLSANNTSDFLITYGAIPDEWGNYFGSLTPRALGERLFLAPYTPEYHLSASCGILDCNAPSAGAGVDFQPGSSCVIDSTRYRTVYVPMAFVSNAPLPLGKDVMVCISRLSAAYSTASTPPQMIYPAH